MKKRTRRSPPKRGRSNLQVPRPERFAKRPLHHAIASAAAKATRRRTRPADLGWAAGFFDADGHLSAPAQKHAPYPNGQPRKPSIRLVASVSQNDREVLEHFQRVVGAHGKIYRQTRNIGQNRQCYALMYSGRHALEVIYVLRPHLRRKQYQADAAKELAIKGRLGMYPGRRGFPESVKRARRQLPKKISRLK
jgi:hypothetical protein